MKPSPGFSEALNGFSITILQNENGLVSLKCVSLYDPYSGRFLSEDPIGFYSDNNLYRYAQSNPIRYSDPTGKYSQAAIAYIALRLGLINAVEVVMTFCSADPAMCAKIYDEWVSSKKPMPEPPEPPVSCNPLVQSCPPVECNPLYQTCSSKEPIECPFKSK